MLQTHTYTHSLTDRHRAIHRIVEWQIWVAEWHSKILITNSDGVNDLAESFASALPVVYNPEKKRQTVSKDKKTKTFASCKNLC